MLDDADVIADARSAAISLVDEDPELLGHPALLAEVEALTADERADYLERS